MIRVLRGVNELNQLELVNGKLLESQNEVLVDQVFFENNGLSLGDELVFDEACGVLGYVNVGELVINKLLSVFISA